MAITPTSSRTYTFLKNATSVARTVANPGSGDVSTYVVTKGTYFINLTAAEMEDFFEAVSEARAFVPPV